MHLKHFRQVFECLNKHVYHVCLAKCTFCETSVPFLGYTLMPEGITASEKRHMVISAFQLPVCIGEATLCIFRSCHMV